MDLVLWIADYATYLKTGGYTVRTIGLRLKHLSYLNRFLELRGLKTLEEFGPELTGDFIDYWVNHHPRAQKPEFHAIFVHYTESSLLSNAFRIFS